MAFTFVNLSFQAMTALSLSLSFLLFFSLILSFCIITSLPLSLSHSHFFYIFFASLSLFHFSSLSLSFSLFLSLSPRYFLSPTQLRAPPVKVDSKAGEFSVDSKTSLRHSPFQLLRNRRKSGTNTKVKFLRKLPQKLEKNKKILTSFET